MLPINRRATNKLPVEQTQTPPPSHGGGQPATKNGHNQGKPSHTRPKHPSASPPMTGRRVKVKPAPATHRPPKVVRFAFDETRNTAMETIVRPYFRGPPSSSSSDPTDDSFTETSSLITPITPITPPTPQFGFDQTTLGPSYVDSQPAPKPVRFAPDHTSFRNMEWNAVPASNKMSRKASVKNWIDAAPEPAYQTAHPTPQTFQPPKVPAKLISPVRGGKGVVAPSESMYLPDSDSDLWNSDSDLDSFIDPGDCVVTSDENGWHWHDYESSQKSGQPIFIIQSTESKASHSPSPAKKPLEPVFIYRKKGQSAASCLKNPLFVWRPSSDVKKETRTTHGSPPPGFSKYFATFHTTTEDKPSSPQRSHHKHHRPTNDETTANASSGSRAERDHSKKRTHRHDSIPSKPTHSHSSRHSHSTRNRKPPSVISEEDTDDDEDEDDDDDAEEAVGTGLGVTWRDV